MAGPDMHHPFSQRREIHVYWIVVCATVLATLATLTPV